MSYNAAFIVAKPAEASSPRTTIFPHPSSRVNVYLLDLTLPSAEENLALDEALLDEAEAGDVPLETLRLWESAAPLVVVGRSSKVADEVHVEACRDRGIPVLRRTSGGAAIVTGPGCLMYAVVLNCRLRPRLRQVDQAHAFVLDTLARALRPFAPGVGRQGISDLAIGREKFSGNSVRIKRDHLLYHGTLLYDFPLRLIDECLAMPPRRPDYREDRPHRTFVTNLPLSAEFLARIVKEAWAAEPRADWPGDRTARLVAERYGRCDWNQ